MRPNLFANTPDILHAYLQQGGRPAFEARLLLAATLGAALRHLQRVRAVREPRGAWHRGIPGLGEVPGQAVGLGPARATSRRWSARVNDIRRDNPALWTDASLRFHAVRQPAHHLLQQADARPHRTSCYVIVNLDPFNTREGHVQVAVPRLAPRPGGLPRGRHAERRTLLVAGRVELRPARPRLPAGPRPARDGRPPTACAGASGTATRTRALTADGWRLSRGCRREVVPWSGRRQAAPPPVHQGARSTSTARSASASGTNR